MRKLFAIVLLLCLLGFAQSAGAQSADAASAPSLNPAPSAPQVHLPAAFTDKLEVQRPANVDAAK